MDNDFDTKVKKELNRVIQTTNEHLAINRSNNPPDILPVCRCWLDQFLADYTSQEITAAQHILALLFTVSGGEIGVSEMSKVMAHFDVQLYRRNYPLLYVGDEGDETLDEALLGVE